MLCSIGAPPSAPTGLTPAALQAVIADAGEEAAGAVGWLLADLVGQAPAPKGEEWTALGKEVESWLDRCMRPGGWENKVGRAWVTVLLG